MFRRLVVAPDGDIADMSGIGEGPVAEHQTPTARSWKDRHHDPGDLERRHVDRIRADGPGPGRHPGRLDDGIAAARNSPLWPGLEALAPTLAYDAACLGDGRPPAERLARITQPTLVATGAVPDPHTGGLRPGFFDQAADAIAATIPKTERVIVDGQAHVADPVVLSSVLERFLSHGKSGS